MEVILHIFTVNYIFKIEIIKKGFKIQFQPRVYKKKKNQSTKKKTTPINRLLIVQCHFLSNEIGVTDFCLL